MLAILMAEKMSGTSVKIIKNEVGCRDDTVPKTVETRTLRGGLRACNNLPQPPPYIFGFWGLRKIVACSQSSSQWFLGVAEDCCMLSILLAVPSCFNSFWHGVIPTSYFIFNDFYTCINYSLWPCGCFTHST